MENQIRKKFTGKTAKIRGYVGPVIFVGPSKQEYGKWRVGIRNAPDRDWETTTILWSS